MAASKRTPPWKKANPRPEGRSQKLTPAQKSAARSRARRAGRRYPNLVDNMHAAQNAAPSSATGRKRAPSATRGSAKRKAPATKDPKGGLTAAGRQAFKRSTGAKLKPGVKKPISEMTPEEMRRKGSWAVRFYGRSGRLPPLKDKSGEPTRFALTARAWGEPVPKTVAAARRIADKGRRLLARYTASQKR